MSSMSLRTMGVVRSTGGTVHTQTIEGFFSNLKRGVAGTYHSVSRKWLQSYLNEYAWRYNSSDERAQFRSLFLTATR
jgi:ISXO2 transposase-like protein